MGGWREILPKLSRSALHRGLERPGLSRLPRDQANTSKRQRFAATTLGDVPIDRCDLRRAEDAATRMHGAAFLRDVVATFPDALHTVLTDTGMAFADLPQDRDGPTATWMGHLFGRVCREQGIEPKLTRPSHPGMHGQAERMNRTVKDATLKAFHDPDLEALQAHLLAFIRAPNCAKHLKALRGRTPFQAVCEAWTKDPSIFKVNPHHLIPGPNT